MSLIPSVQLLRRLLRVAQLSHGGDQVDQVTI